MSGRNAATPDFEFMAKQILMDLRLRVTGISLALGLLAGCGIRHSTVVVQPGDARPASALSGAAARGRLDGDHYIVGKGDTLYSIAFRNGVDFRTLASWNNIAEPYRIWPGQSLRLKAPVAAPAGSGTGFSPVVEAAPAAQPLAAASRPVVLPSPPVSRAVVATPAAAAPAARAEIPAAVKPAAAPPVVAAPAAALANGASRNSGGITWRWPASGPLIKRYQAGDAIPGIEIAGKAGDPVRAAADGVVVYSGNGLVGYGELIIIKHSDALLSAYGHNSTRLVKEGQTVKSGQKIAEMGSSGASRVELQFQVRRDGNPVDPMAYLPPQ